MVHSGAREITGELHLRYAITVGDCFCYRNNFYGGSIVNASRTLAKDQLNRILIDNNVHEWFSRYFMGIANLPNITDSDLKKCSVFADYKDQYSSYNIFSDKSDLGRIISVSELKLQQTSSKMTALELYVLAIQFELNATDQMTKTVRLGLGNLNTTGLD
jgi:hypothetical protein